MKKFLAILVLGLTLFVVTADAFAKTKRTVLKKGRIIEGEIVWTQKFRINLPPGQWEVVEKTQWSYNSLFGKFVGLAQLNGKQVDRYIEIETVSVNGKWISYLNQWFREIFLINKYDGCYDRPEYYLVEVYKRGAAINCFLIRHDETRKSLYAPDDHRRKTYTAIIRKWIRENNIEVPPIELNSWHIFYAPSVKDTLYSYYYWINPEILGASKSKFLTEETSEYHRANISNYPNKKKIMESFISSEAYKHQMFEEMLGAKPRHKLALNQYIKEKDIEKIIKTKSITKTTSSGFTEKLKELHELYKEGALTKEEFEKAKKKILSQ